MVLLGFNFGPYLNHPTSLQFRHTTYIQASLVWEWSTMAHKALSFCLTVHVQNFHPLFPCQKRWWLFTNHHPIHQQNMMSIDVMFFEKLVVLERTWDVSTQITQDRRPLWDFDASSPEMWMLLTPPKSLVERTEISSKNFMWNFTNELLDFIYRNGHLYQQEMRTCFLWQWNFHNSSCDRTLSRSDEYQWPDSL